MQFEPTIVRGQLFRSHTDKVASTPILVKLEARDSKPRCFGQVHAKTILPTLIPSIHLSGGMAELPLNVALIDLCTKNKARPQAMAREQRKTVARRQFTEDSGAQHRLLDQAHDVVVREAPIKHACLATTRPARQRVKVDLGKTQPLLQGIYAARLVGRPATNLNFAPTPFAAQKPDRTVVFNLTPAAAIGRPFAVCDIMTIATKAHNLRPAQNPNKTDQQDRTGSVTPQTKGQGGDHGADTFSQHGFLLNRGPSVLALDTCKNSRYVPFFAVERNSALLLVPRKARKAALDGRYSQRKGRGLGIERCTVHNVASYQLRPWGRGGSVFLTPANKIHPVVFVGDVGASSTCGACSEIVPKK